MNTKRFLALLGALLTLTSLLCACSKGEWSPMEAEPGYYDGADYSYNASPVADGLTDAYKKDAAEVPAEGEKTVTGENDLAERKIIRNYQINGETLTYEESLAALKDKIAACGGYVEQSSEQDRSYYSENLRYARLVIRIPEKRSEEFLGGLDGLLNLTRCEESTEDVTLAYVDIESRVKALRAEETALLSMLEKAEDVGTLITIQDRLSQLRYEIESYQSRLNKLDNLVSYCTFTVSLTEVADLTKIPEKNQTVWQEIGEKFKQSLADVGYGLRCFFVWFVGNLPHIVVWLVVVALIVFVVILLCRGGKKRRAKRAAKKAAKGE